MATRAKVILKNNETLEKLISRFKKQVSREGILRQYRDKRYYDKPSVVRHKKKLEILHKRKLKKYGKKY
jgi:small subunit ribosomal protein S21